MNISAAQSDGGIWPRLLENQYVPLHVAADACDTGDVASLARLRKHWPADLVRAAIELAAVRRKAKQKFSPEIASQLVGDSIGLEQATSQDVAVHKAARFAGAGYMHIWDMCCGIGGDAMALAARADVSLVDLDRERVWMAQHNTRIATGRTCRTLVRDVTTMEWHDHVFHLDPDRRPQGKRRMNWRDASPGGDFIDRLILEAKAGAIKLPPGVDDAQLPPGEVEIISRQGRLVQAVLWTGELHHNQRTATAFPQGMTFSGTPAALPLAMAARYLYTVDPAIERAELIGNLCQLLNIACIHPALGLLTSDRYLSNPWLTAFELLHDMPWREKKVKRWLSENHAGIVEIKTRGKTVDPDIIQKNLRGKGDKTYTLFILREDRQINTYITRRCATSIPDSDV